MWLKIIQLIGAVHLDKLLSFITNYVTWLQVSCPLKPKFKYLFHYLPLPWLFVLFYPLRIIYLLKFYSNLIKWKTWDNFYLMFHYKLGIIFNLPITQDFDEIFIPYLTCVNSARFRKDRISKIFPNRVFLIEKIQFCV